MDFHVGLCNVEEKRKNSKWRRFHRHTHQQHQQRYMKKHILVYNIIDFRLFYMSLVVIFLFFFYSFILSFCYRFTGWNPTAFLSINLMEFDVHSATVSMISSTMLNHCYFRIRFLMVFRIIFHLFRHKLSFDFY